MKKFLISNLLMVALSSLIAIGAFAEENVEEIDGNEGLQIEMIEETDPELAKEQAEKVFKDMKAHPELVQPAEPVEFQTFATLPYSFNFDFKWNITSQDFSSLEKPTIKAQLDVKTSTASYVYLSLYRTNGTFLGTRTYQTGKISTGSFFDVGLGSYRVYLTNSNPGDSRTYGSAFIYDAWY